MWDAPGPLPLACNRFSSGQAELCWHAKSLTLSTASLGLKALSGTRAQGDSGDGGGLNGLKQW